jgi:hypothetical protein
MSVSQAMRAAHLDELRTQWETMEFAELRTRVLGVVTVHFIMSEILAGGLSEDRPARFNALIAHYSTMGEVELREAASGVIAAHQETLDDVLMKRAGDPVLFGLGLLEGLANELCDAAQSALAGDESWSVNLAAQVERLKRLPPLGV